MKITLLSDLHLESQGLSGLSGGDVLLLAGDTCEVNNLSRFTGFMEEISEKFRNVYVIAGNHEFYGSDINLAEQLMRDIYKPYKNIDVLINESRELTDKIRLWAGTFWTNFNNEDFASEQECNRCMNDFRCISNGRGGLFHPADAIAEYNKAKASLESNLNYFNQKEFVVMSHHAPSQLSINAKFKPYQELNGGFCNHLDGFIWGYPQIKFWCHGHVHNSFDYKVGSCQIYCNPRGYGKENKFLFNKNFSFEV
jgi:DNA repair exonuclease SbcCD nuclease subunit